MELISEFAKILLPAGLVLYAMYLTVKNMLDKEIARKQVEYRLKMQETTLPLRLQAYERLSLLLERITPKNLLLRVNDPSYSVQQLQVVLIREIREEFNHNLSQQIFISDELWTLVKKAVEDTISLISQCASSLNPESRGVDLIKNIFEKVMAMQVDPVSHALHQLKNEVRQFY